MDRVSSLPDDVLCHILSFLPTKDTTLTSALSKRWVNLWKHVPNIDIDDSVFLHPEEGKAEREEIRQSFVGFVDRVLALQGDSPVKRFSLKCISGVHPDCVNRWICNVLQRGVSVFELSTYFPFEEVLEEGYKLPVEMCGSRNLVELKIRSENYVVWWCAGICNTLFTTLKTLDIHSASSYYGQIEKFLPNFPVLEDLRMGYMEWLYPDVTISSASLKTLSIDAGGSEGFNNPKSISFDTPNLLSLSYSDLVADDYPLVNMNKLTHATISLRVLGFEIERIRAPINDLLDDDVVLRLCNVVKLMNGIENVEKLELCSNILEVLSLCSESMPVFKNLKTLYITSEKDRGWQAMLVLLRSCPHLETIIFQGLLHHVTVKCGDACPCIPQEDIGLSLKSCPVKVLEIHRFRVTIWEILIIKHFLEYFPCLEVIRVDGEAYDPTHAVSQLFELYRVSFMN